MFVCLFVCLLFYCRRRKEGPRTHSTTHMLYHVFTISKLTFVDRAGCLCLCVCFALVLAAFLLFVREVHCAAGVAFGLPTTMEQLTMILSSQSLGGYIHSGSINIKCMPPSPLQILRIFSRKWKIPLIWQRYVVSLHCRE